LVAGILDLARSDLRIDGDSTSLLVHDDAGRRLVVGRNGNRAKRKTKRRDPEHDALSKHDRASFHPCASAFGSSTEKTRLISRSSSRGTCQTSRLSWAAPFQR